MIAVREINGYAEFEKVADLPLCLLGGRYQMHAANELGKRIGKIREMISSMEDEARIQKDAIKDLKEREVALVSELLYILTEE
jgi:hypothetical protein